MPSPAPTPPSPDPAARPCPRCHQPIPTGAAHGLCPACLLAAGFFTQAALDDPAASDAPPPSPAELAAEFPSLEILDLLGQGGMGAVYKARQRHLDRLVALKLLRPGLDVDPTFADRFTREARALAQLNHPGIVTLHEFGPTPGGRYFILMEFVDGVNLRQLLAGGRLSPREALAIIPPLCDALQYAHDRGLVHRDIKPENILVDRLGRVKIADFGLAKLAAPSGSDLSVFVSRSTASAPPASGDLTEAGKVLGTPRYMAPEQREHPAAVDHRSDIYALGVVLYQMLTGELPDEKHLQPPSHRVQLDVRLDEIVLRALEKNPDLRYAAASEFKTRLETVAATATAAEPAAAPAPITVAPSASSALPPWLGFIVLYIGHLSLLIVTAKDLPLRVASHFNGDGRADGWMPRGDYLLFSAVFPLALGLFLALLAWSLRVLPPSLINLPHRDHWLAPENKAATATLFARWMAAPACLLVVFFSQLGWLVARANLSATPRLPGGPMIGITIGFLAALMIWLVGLVLRFAEPKATPAKLRRQHASLLAAALLALVAPAAHLIAEWRKPPDKPRESPAPSAQTSAHKSRASPSITVHVTGAVNRPGSYPLRPDASLLDALAAAGGWTRTADWSAIRIDGPAPAQTGEHHLGAILEGDAINPRLSEGATVFLPSRNH